MEDPKPPENRNINTDGGNYNERIEGDYIQGNVFQNIFNILGGQTTTPVGNPARPKNERILLAAVKEEVTSRLRQSLHNAVLINLGKESQPQQVKRPWDAEIKIGLKPAVPLPDNTTILSVFESEEIAGKLLILGAPGSGKTTTQLELAQALVNRAQEQPEYPVPVLFNLSSWKDGRQSITDWLVAELKSKYGVSNKLGKEWVDNQQLLLLLDGLDELEPQRQELCVHAINQFLASEIRPLSLVVCSRIEEYRHYSSNLNLNGAICLWELNETQISEYFEAVGRVEFWQTLQQDETLLKLMITPLFLSITVLSVQELSIEDWQRLETMEARIEYLFDAYWRQQMFNRDYVKELYVIKNNLRFFLDKYIRRLFVEPGIQPYIQHKPPIPRQTKLWLIWLAQQMQRESKTEFLIEEMQPYWLVGTSKRLSYQLTYQIIYQLVNGMVMGFILGISMTLGVLINGVINGGLFNGLMSLIIVPVFLLVFVLIFVLFGGLLQLILWSPFGLIGSMFAGRDKWEITLSEKIVLFDFNKKKIFKIITEALLFGMIGMLINKLNGLIIGLIFGLIGGLFENLVSVKPDINIENKKIANQGIWKSAIIGLIFALIRGIMGGLLLGLIGMLINGQSEVIIGLTFFGLIGVLPSGPFSSGGNACIQHFTLRLILYRNGYIPWNYARFLDYCTERLLLQRVGGRYRFIHRLLQDHFAQLEFKRN